MLSARRMTVGAVSAMALAIPIAGAYAQGPIVTTPGTPDASVSAPAPKCPGVLKHADRGDIGRIRPLDQTVYPGQEMRWRFVLNNNTSSRLKIGLEATFDRRYFTVISRPATCFDSPDGSKTVWRAGILKSGQRRTLDFFVKVSPNAPAGKYPAPKLRIVQ